MRQSVVKAKGTTFSTIEIGKGPVVLFLHGFPDSKESFIPLMEKISSKGYRCIAVTLRGYEPQSITHWSKLHLTDLIEDVKEWIESESWGKIHFIGHDWGAVIGYVCAMHYPNRFHSLTAMSVPMLKKLPEGLLWTPQQTLHSWYILLFQVPLIAELLIKANQYALIDYFWKEWSKGYQAPAEHLNQIKASFENPGVLASALSYYRNLSDLFSASGRETFLSWMDAKVSAPTQILFGAEDTCIHPRLYKSMIQAEDFPFGLKLEELEGVGHFPHLESTEKVASFCLDWIERNLS